MALAVLLAAAAAERTSQRFSVEVTVSKAVAQYLTEESQSLIVNVTFFGWPKQMPARLQDGQLGEVRLGMVRAKLREAGSVSISAPKISAEELAALADPDFEALISVFSGGQGGPTWLLRCDSIHEHISKLDQQVRKVHCALVSESKESQ